jgi:hypothetical protein
MRAAFKDFLIAPPALSEAAPAGLEPPTYCLEGCWRLNNIDDLGVN